jgi:dihydrolipoamide dehydrogenase
LELREIPGRLLVIGGGIIGLELATVYDALGSKVTVVELLDRLMTGCDADLVKPLERRIGRRYEAILLGTKVESVAAGDGGLTVAFGAPKSGKASPKPAPFDAILVAVGRRANGDAIGAEKAGVEVTERGVIPVDRAQRTNVPHLFAIGDLTGEPMLAHKASHQGKVAAEVAAGEKSSFDAVAVPAVAYTDPEVAWVGLGEEEAARQGRKVATGSFPWLASARSLGLGRSDGFTKLVFDPETRRLLGAGIVGPRAGDLIAEATLALEMGCDADDLALTIHPHPTLSETVMLAAEAFAGTITDLYLGKKTAAVVKK